MQLVPNLDLHDTNKITVEKADVYKMLIEAETELAANMGVDGKAAFEKLKEKYKEKSSL